MKTEEITIIDGHKFWNWNLSPSISKKLKSIIKNAKNGKNVKSDLEDFEKMEKFFNSIKDASNPVVINDITFTDNCFSVFKLFYDSIINKKRIFRFLSLSNLRLNPFIFFLFLYASMEDEFLEYLNKRSDMKFILYSFPFELIYPVLDAQPDEISKNKDEIIKRLLKLQLETFVDKTLNKSTKWDFLKLSIFSNNYGIPEKFCSYVSDLILSNERLKKFGIINEKVGKNEIFILLSTLLWEGYYSHNNNIFKIDWIHTWHADYSTELEGQYKDMVYSSSKVDPKSYQFKVSGYSLSSYKNRSVKADRIIDFSYLWFILIIKKSMSMLRDNEKNGEELFKSSLKFYKSETPYITHLTAVINEAIFIDGSDAARFLPLILNILNNSKIPDEDLEKCLKILLEGYLVSKSFSNVSYEEFLNSIKGDIRPPVLAFMLKLFVSI